MYSCVVARPKGDDAYDWYTYEGKRMDLPFRGITIPLMKGQQFGVRKSGNGKFIRLVMEGDVNRVMTIDLPTAKKIAKGVKP